MGEPSCFERTGAAFGVDPSPGRYQAGRVMPLPNPPKKTAEVP